MAFSGPAPAAPHLSSLPSPDTVQGARFSKHRLLGTAPAVAIPVLPARSHVQEEQWDTSVPAGAEVRAGNRSWQRCSAWQDSRGPDLSGFENRMGTRRTFVFSLGAGTGPSGCSWDVSASRLWRGGGGPRSDTLGNPIAPLHPSYFVLCQQIPKLSPSSPTARLAGEASLGAQAGMSSSSPQLETPLALITGSRAGEPREVREFVVLLHEKCDCCPGWHRALNWKTSI